MSREESESVQSEKPVMDDETNKFVQELFQLARVGDAERLKEFLEIGLTTNIRDGKDNGLLMLASYNGNYEAARALLEQGGNPEIANDNGQIPLAGTTFKGNAEMTRLLIEHGADVNDCMPDGKPPLMFAAVQPHRDHRIAARGADPALQSGDGKTALDPAQEMGAQDGL